MSALDKAIEASLEGMNLRSSREGAAITATRGAGLQRTSAALNLDALRAWLDAHPGADLKRAVGAFARGVHAVLNEPANSDAAAWPFVEAAGRLTPSIEFATFEAGVQATGAGRPWLVDFSPDLSVAYTIELDRGTRLLTWAQFLQWGVTPDRVTSASRSLLYFKTAQHALGGGFEPDAASGGQTYSVGDGIGAARALILGDLDYHRARRGILFAVPHPDLLLTLDQQSDPSVLDRFKAAAQAAYSAADFPLSPLIYTHAASGAGDHRALETPAWA